MCRPTVKHFSEAFLLTYYTFITPEELITKLLYRYAFMYMYMYICIIIYMYTLYMCILPVCTLGTVDSIACTCNVLYICHVHLLFC